MRILVIGSGGREHAICAAFARSDRVSKMFCANGNAGIAQIAELVDITPVQIEELADFASLNEIDLTFVGGETALALGIVDEFEKRGLRIVGASKLAARLEASKAFAKDFMARHNIPTAMHRTANSAAEAIGILRSGEFGDEQTPVVVKADGLAAGKGVVVAKDRAEAIAAINGMESLVGKDATEKIVLEECLVGREVSLLMFADGKNFALMPPTRDHKRIGDGDTGPNTGGMGTVTDSLLLTDEQTKQIVAEMVKPTLAGCAAEGFPFRGILFLGLMMTDLSEPPALAGGSDSRSALNSALTIVRASAPEDAVPMLLEYNVRFGDPETQSILVRLETDLVDICELMLAGRLDETQIEWSEGNSATIVLAAQGYPEKPRTGDVIHGIEIAELHDGISIFHAGTAFSSPPVLGGVDAETPLLPEEGWPKAGVVGADVVVLSSDKDGSSSNQERTTPSAKRGHPSFSKEGSSDDGKLVTAGGRVLGVTATADNLLKALDKAYEAVNDISWDGMQYRKDIGK